MVDRRAAVGAIGVAMIAAAMIAAAMAGGVSAVATLQQVAAVPAPVSAAVPAEEPVPRGDRNSQIAHDQLLAKARRGGIDVYFEGDSIVRRWGALDYPELLANWRLNFFGWNAANFGWGADT